MLKKIILSVLVLLTASKIMAQQIPVGMCGIVYLYDANGARVKRTYFCNNGTDPYPTARPTNQLQSDSAKVIVEDKGETTMVEKIDAIFPNPTTGKFSITFKSSLKNVKITIVDVNGKVVLKTIGNGSKLDFDISSLASGTFFVAIEENGKVITQKVIKQ